AVKAFISGFKKHAEKQAKREAKEARDVKETEKRARKETEERARREASEATIERVPRPTSETAEVKTEVKAEGTLEERVLAELNIGVEDEGVVEDSARRAAEVKEATEAAVKEKSNKAAAGTDSETYEGQVQLVVPPPASFEQVRQFQECLKRVDNLRLVMVGGSMDEGALLIVALQAPMALGKILNQMPMVATVEKKGKKLGVILKPSAGN
ncbi:MAG: hypothetical protein Q8O05_00390, partial [Chloroflexota bacterium]|nr:hypothetical protein [Chloroflexota bacterium]